MALLTASLPAFAAASPTTKAIGRVTVSSKIYNGKKQEPTVRVYDTTGKRVLSRYYTARVAGYPRDAGTYRVTVTAIAPYTGKKTVAYVIKRASNPFTIKVGKTTFRRNKYRSQTTSIKVIGVKENAKVGKWSSSSPNVYVKGGKIIVRKGFYGSATLSVKVYATKNYKGARKSIRISVKK
jgi:hypothetical protein